MISASKKDVFRAHKKKGYERRKKKVFEIINIDEYIKNNSID